MRRDGCASWHGAAGENPDAALGACAHGRPRKTAGCFTNTFQQLKVLGCLGDATDVSLLQEIVEDEGWEDFREEASDALDLLRTRLHPPLPEEAEPRDRTDTLENPYPHLGCKLYGVDFDVLLGVNMKKRGADDPDGLASARLAAVQDLVLKAADHTSAAKIARRFSCTCCEAMNSIIRNEEKCVHQAIMSAAKRVRLNKCQLSCFTLFK